MSDIKLISLLKTFSKEEMKEFELFVHSPFFNKEKVLMKLCSVLRKHHPGFNGRALNKESLFEILYPGKKYNDSIMRNNFSKILTLAEHYLAIKNFSDEKFGYNLSLMKELSKRQQKKLFEKILPVETNLLESSAPRDEQYFYKKLLLTDEIWKFNMNQKSAMDYSSIDFVFKIQDSLVPYALISIFKTGCYLMNTRSKMFSQEHDAKLFNKLEEYLMSNEVKFRDYVYIWYYYFAYKLGTSKDEKYFFSLKKITENNYDELNLLEKRNIYVILTNYCYVKTNNGELKFSNEHFKLLKDNVEKGHYLTSGNFMTHIFYMNVVITGLEAGENEWIKNFIEKHKAELDKENIDNTVNFSLAFYFYYLKEYDKALEYAALVGVDDLSYKHQLKSFYLKIFFDMNETEPFYSHVDNYRHFISSEKNIDLAMKDTIGNYIGFTKRIFDIKNNLIDKDYKTTKLKNEITQSTNLINKGWLLKRIDELKR